MAIDLLDKLENQKHTDELFDLLTKIEVASISSLSSVWVPVSNTKVPEPGRS